jgi:hypothetical protein
MGKFNDYLYKIEKMKKLCLLCAMVIVIAFIGMTSCTKKDDGKITAEKVDAAYRSAGWAVASTNAYNTTIDNKNLEAVWHVAKKIGNDDVAGKIYVFSNSTTKEKYWDTWEATYPDNSHDFIASGSQNALLTEISVNGEMGITLSAALRLYGDFGKSGPGLNDEPVKALTSVLYSIKY